MIRLSSLTTLWPNDSGQPTRGSQTRPQQAFLAITLIVGVVLVLCLYLHQASRVTAVYYDTIKVEREYARIERENSLKLAELAQAQSITEMDKIATAAGYAPADTIRYVTVQPLSRQANARSEEGAVAAADTIEQNRLATTLMQQAQ